MFFTHTHTYTLKVQLAIYSVSTKSMKTPYCVLMSFPLPLSPVVFHPAVLFLMLSGSQF